eukprot:1789703-Rhodomonas_salina.1
MSGGPLVVRSWCHCDAGGAKSSVASPGTEPQPEVTGSGSGSSEHGSESEPEHGTAPSERSEISDDSAAAGPVIEASDKRRYSGN